MDVDTDRVWPDVVKAGIIIHHHGLSEECNIRCYVARLEDVFPRDREDHA